jgi:hypothetical protein
MDPTKIDQWYDDARKKADVLGWSSNESRYWDFCNRYVRRKALELGCKKLGTNDQGAKNSRALQSLVKSTLSELEAEKQGIFL